jgi:hypothetical protein
VCVVMVQSISFIEGHHLVVLTDSDFSVVTFSYQQSEIVTKYYTVKLCYLELDRTKEKGKTSRKCEISKMKYLIRWITKAFRHIHCI